MAVTAVGLKWVYCWAQIPFQGTNRIMDTGLQPQKAHESLGGKSPLQQAEFNSEKDDPRRIKNDNFFEILNK